jgi:hypothetical protein
MSVRVDISRFTESPEDSWEVQGHYDDFVSVDLGKSSRERFYPNEYYGLDLIVKFLLDLDEETTLPFGLPHAVCFGYQPGWYVYGKREKVKTLVYYNDLDLKVMQRRNCKGWIAKCENLFMTLLKIMQFSIETESNAKYRNGLLHFPVHSNSVWRPKSDSYDRNTIAHLKSMLSDFEIVDVILPLDSIIAGRGILYQDAGFRVISAGSVLDPKFLCRWVNLVSTYQTMSTSHLGSHVFYGLAIRRKIHWILDEKLNPPPKIDDKTGTVRPVMEPFPEALALLKTLHQNSSKTQFDTNFWFGSSINGELSESKERLKDVYNLSKIKQFSVLRPNLKRLI